MITLDTTLPTEFDTCREIAGDIVNHEADSAKALTNRGNELLKAYQALLAVDDRFTVAEFENQLAAGLGFNYKSPKPDGKTEKVDGQRGAIREASPFLKQYFWAMGQVEAAFLTKEGSKERKAIAQKRPNLKGLSTASTMADVRNGAKSLTEARKEWKKAETLANDKTPFGEASRELKEATDKCAALVKAGFLTEADMIEAINRATDAFNRQANKGQKAMDKATAQAEKEAEAQKAATKKAASKAATKRHAKPKAKAKQAA